MQYPWNERVFKLWVIKCDITLVGVSSDTDAPHHRKRVPEDTASPAPIGFFIGLGRGGICSLIPCKAEDDAFN